MIHATIKHVLQDTLSLRPNNDSLKSLYKNASHYIYIAWPLKNVPVLMVYNISLT